MNRTLSQAIRGLKNNLVRTILTTLGIVIGIAMVITVLSAGEGFRSYIVKQVEVFGTNFLTVETRVPPTTKARGSVSQGISNSSAVQAVTISTLVMRDLEDIKRLPNVNNGYGAVIGQKVSAYKNIKKNAFIFGADEQRFNIDKGILSTGRFFTREENLGAAQVAILGSDIAEDFFGNDDPVGKTIRVGEYNFLVIGVYEPRGSFGFNNEDQQIFAPLRTVQKKIMGIDHLFYLVVELADQNLAEATAEDVQLLLRHNHSILDPDKDDFYVQTQVQALGTISQILSGISFLLVAIAAISLVVGGVGIMNIMYVAVSERTSEIGLKKALGAKYSDILWEFLFEALLITLLGGVFGIILGAGLSYAIAKVAESFNFAWKFSVPLTGVLAGLGVSGTIGLVFGVFPARRAAKLNPIDALRFE